MLDTLFHTLDTLKDDRLFLIAMVLLIARLKRVSYANRFLFSLVNLLGTFFHELSHYLVGQLLWASPDRFSLWPKARPDGGYVMGSVTFSRLNFFNTLPTALSPLLIIGLVIYLDQLFRMHVEETLSATLLYLFAVVILLENALPSATDFRVAFNQRLGVAFYLFAGLAYWWRDEWIVFLPHI